jgi:hypothetical protein
VAYKVGLELVAQLVGSLLAHTCRWLALGPGRHPPPLAYSQSAHAGGGIQGHPDTWRPHSHASSPFLSYPLLPGHPLPVAPSPAGLLLSLTPLFRPRCAFSLSSPPSTPRGTVLWGYRELLGPPPRA